MHFVDVHELFMSSAYKLHLAMAGLVWFLLRLVPGN